MACMYLLFGVVVVDNWYLHKIQNRYPQHYPTYHLVYQGSGMAKFEKYSQRGLVFFFPVGTLQVPTYLLFAKVLVFFFTEVKKKTKPFLLKFKGPTFNKFYIFCQDGFVSAERETAGLIRWSSNLTVCFLYLAVTSYLRFATCLSSVLIPLNILYQIFCVRFQFS